MTWDLLFYVTPSGRQVVQDFIRKQDKATKAKIARTLDLLSIHGPDLGMPHARYLGSHLYELRIRGKNEVRMFYVLQVAPKAVVIVHAFNKRSQKLPQRELEIAKIRAGELTEL